jgi:hypothetical protein
MIVLSAPSGAAARCISENFRTLTTVIISVAISPIYSIIRSFRLARPISSQSIADPFLQLPTLSLKGSDEQVYVQKTSVDEEEKVSRLQSLADRLDESERGEGLHADLADRKRRLDEYSLPENRSNHG